MPLEIAAEILLRFLFESIFYFLGYGTGRVLVALFSFGRYTTEPLLPPKRGKRRTRIRGPKVARQLSVDATALIGILFWTLPGMLWVVYWWLFKAG